jgi:hypothetical protein
MRMLGKSPSNPSKSIPGGRKKTAKIAQSRLARLFPANPYWVKGIVGVIVEEPSLGPKKTMNWIAWPRSSADGGQSPPSLARAITTVMIVKLLLLALLWLAFVQGQEILVDAQNTAEAFGLLRAPHPSEVQWRGDRRGQ